MESEAVGEEEEGEAEVKVEVEVEVEAEAEAEEEAWSEWQDGEAVVVVAKATVWGLPPEESEGSGRPAEWNDVWLFATAEHTQFAGGAGGDMRAVEGLASKPHPHSKLGPGCPGYLTMHLEVKFQISYTPDSANSR